MKIPVGDRKAGHVPQQKFYLGFEPATIMIVKKKTALFIIGVVILAVVGLVYLLNLEDISDHGRIYSSKSSLCMEFAQSYLRTIPKTENNFNGKKWEMAIDVETELYNMCLLELNPETIGSYKPKALEKYSK